MYAKNLVRNIATKKGVLLDIDNTLYDYVACHRCALRECYKRFRRIKNISFKEFEEKYEYAKKNIKQRVPHHAASHSRFLYFQSFFEDCFGKTCVDLTIKFEKIYWKSFFQKMILFPWVLPFLKTLKKHRVRICVITDLTAKIQFEKIKILGIDRYIDFVVSSEEVGIEKPSPRVFLLAIKKLGLESNDIAVIGDDAMRDGRGAQEAGLKSIII